MKFVYYGSLASCLKVSFETLNSESLNELKDKAEKYFKKNESLICDNKTLSMTDVFALIDDLDKPTTIIFHDWIKNDEAISKILHDTPEKLNFQERFSNNKYKGHALERQFYAFLTPFLFPVLKTEVTKSFKSENFEKLRFYLQYSHILEESRKISLQQEVDGWMRSIFLEKRSNFGERGDSKINTEEAKSLWSIDLVNSLNLLDQQFYSLRITYIDTLKSIMVQPDIEPTTFNKMAHAISNVKLNSSHEAQVDSFLQQRKSKVYQKQRTTVFNKALLRNPITYLGLTVILVLIFLLFPPDIKKDELIKNQKITGLDSLSRDEVKQTDSLLAFKEDSVLFETEDLKVPEALADFLLTDNSNEIKNTAAKDIYESMLNDYKIQQKKTGSDCEPMEGKEVKDFNYENIDDLKSEFPNHTLINNSDQDCYIMVFENKEEGAVFGGFVSAGNSVEFKIVKSWRVIFYTGQDFTKFNPLKLSNNGYGNLEDAKKIDKIFTAHFCDMDFSNFKVLSKIYHVATTREVTRLVKNDKGVLEVQSESIKIMK